MSGPDIAATEPTANGDVVKSACCRKAEAEGYVHGIRTAADILIEASTRSKKVQFLYRGRQMAMAVNAGFVKSLAEHLRGCAKKAASSLGVE